MIRYIFLEKSRTVINKYGNIIVENSDHFYCWKTEIVYLYRGGFHGYSGQWPEGNPDCDYGGALRGQDDFDEASAGGIE